MIAQEGRDDTSPRLAMEGRRNAGVRGVMWGKNKYETDIERVARQYHKNSLLLSTTSQMLPMQMNLKGCYNTPASGRSK